MMKISMAVLALLGTGQMVCASELRRANLSPNTAQVIGPLVAGAHQTFSRLPEVELTQNLGGKCKAGRQSSPYALYCSDENRIFVAADLADTQGEGVARYMVAHLFGHAVQVRHGIANRALRAIQADRAREAELRGMVTRQVECIAGVLVGRIGEGGDLDDLFEAEPMTDSHWGATPLSRGPRVSIGLSERAKWFARGATTKDFANCAVGEMGAELILRAER